MIPSEAALAELVGQLAGLQCAWRDKANPQLGATGGPEAWTAISYASDTQKGGYEYRQQPNDSNPNALDSLVYGYALAIVTVEAHSFDWPTQPRAVLARVRKGLRTFTAKAVYQREKMAFVRTGPIVVSRSATKDGRTRLDAFMDWTFAYCDTETPNDDPGQTIATINGGGVVPVTVR